MGRAPADDARDPARQRHAAVVAQGGGRDLGARLTMALPTLYKIHPAIGVARIGNSSTSFFIGPEVPGQPPKGDSTFGSTVPPFKDGGQVKRQGARFRIWRYDDNGKGKYVPVEEK